MPFNSTPIESIGFFFALFIYYCVKMYRLIQDIELRKSISLCI
nr:MAG TPA: hypothetical protein [Caudoviricetes sp.]